jgi:ABC-2 type transport system ATP-binding protein
MEEAHLLCDEIAIMDRGKIIAQGPPAQLLKHTFETTFVRLPLEDSALPEDYPWPRRQRDGSMEIETTDVTDALRRLVEHGVSLDHLKVEPPTLEDLFLELTGKELRS